MFRALQGMFDWIVGDHKEEKKDECKTRFKLGRKYEVSTLVGLKKESLGRYIAAEVLSTGVQVKFYNLINLHTGLAHKVSLLGKPKWVEDFFPSIEISATWGPE